MTKIGDNPPRSVKRFYKLAAIDGGALHLDGRPAKTRAGSTARVGAREAAEGR